MALYFGEIDLATWTALVDRLMSVLTTQLGMTVVSDTGTGNARVLDVSATGYDHNIRFYYASRPSVSILGTDGTTVLYAGSFGYSANSISRYYAIKYNDIISLIMYDNNGSSWSPTFLLCKSNTRTHHMTTHNTYSNRTFYGIVSGNSDIVNTGYGGLYASTTLHTLSGKDIVSPIVLSYDENDGPLCEDYLTDFLACNSFSGVLASKYAIGSAKYICIPVFNNTSKLMRYLMRYE